MESIISGRGLDFVVCHMDELCAKLCMNTTLLHGNIGEEYHACMSCMSSYMEIYSNVELCFNVDLLLFQEAG